MKPRRHTTEFVLNSILGTLGDIKSGIDGKPSKNDDCGGITTASKQLHAAQYLFENSSQLGTCEIVVDGLEEELEKLEGKLPPDLARRLTKQRKVLRDVVKHMVTATKESTEKAAAKSTPIPSVKRWNEQQEVLRKKAVSGSNYPEPTY